MKYILRTIFLFLTLYSCSEPYEDLNPFRQDAEVIAVFSPNGIGDCSYSALMYRGMIAATDSLGISFRPIIPATYEEGAEKLLQLVSTEVKGRKRLIISADPEYSGHLKEKASQGYIVDSDSTRLLVLEGDFLHPCVYTAHVPFSGVMYKAGYVAGRMNGVDNVRIYVANDKYCYIKEGTDGFIQGFTQNKNGYVDVVDLSLINDDDTEGFQKMMLAYVDYAPECSESSDMVLTLCGETIMGFLRFNRENPGSFYTVGIDAQMSDHSSDVPFSYVAHFDKVLSTSISEWNENRLQHYRRFGLKDGWVELVISESFRSELGPLSEQIHSQAIEMEECYED